MSSIKAYNARYAEAQLANELANYIYDLAIYRGATDPIINWLAATPVYLSHISWDKAILKSQHIHLRTRALVVLIHKLCYPQYSIK